MKIRQGPFRIGLGSVVLLVLAWSQLAAAAEAAWVSDRVTVHLRSGAGDEYRIKGTIAHPQEVTVLQNEPGWVQVQLRDSQRTGWIPEAYVTRTPPASQRVDELEREARNLRESRDQAKTEIERLVVENEALVATEADQGEEIIRLTAERNELRALLRWREWITGASILVVGMIAGALLARSSRRNRSNRLRV